MALRSTLSGLLISAASALMPAALSAQPSYYDVDVYVEPPPRYEPLPPDRYVSRYWDANRHVWVERHWVDDRPAPVWVPRQWIWRNGRYVLEEGHWEY